MSRTITQQVFKPSLVFPTCHKPAKSITRHIHDHVNSHNLINLAAVDEYCRRGDTSVAAVLFPGLKIAGLVKLGQ